MPSRDQQRAALAFRHVTKARELPEADWKKYKTMVDKLPALLQAAGLCQTLHFVHSRGGKAHPELLAAIAEQMHRVDAGIASAEKLLAAARTADLDAYLRLTDEAMACAAWYRRLVQGLGEA